MPGPFSWERLIGHASAAPKSETPHTPVILALVARIQNLKMSPFSRLRSNGAQRRVWILATRARMTQPETGESYSPSPRTEASSNALRRAARPFSQRMASTSATTTTPKASSHSVGLCASLIISSLANPLAAR